MLEAIRTTLDGLGDDEKKHYVEKDGKFYLDVGSVDGVALENVTGLKKTVEALRASERKLKAELDKVNADWADMDPSAAKDALEKMDEMKNWNKDKKVQEVIEANKRELIKQHELKVVELQAKLEKARGQLKEAIVVSKIVEALQKEGGNVELLLPHVQKSVQMKEGNDGNYYPEVVGDNGDPRVGDTSGSPMTILQRVQEMKSQKSFAPAFTGANSTGSGQAGGGSDGKSGSSTSGGVIKVTGGQVQVSNLEDVASGKVKVEM